MDYNLLFFLILSLVVLGFGAVGISRLIPWLPKNLIFVALLLRVFGSLFRYEILQNYYRGGGDASRYYRVGLDLARRVWDLDSDVVSLNEWFPTGGWWGASFIEHVSGLVLTFIGPSMRGEFLIFSLFAFVGVLLIVVALSRVAPLEVAKKGAVLLLMWPSLWFWPSSVGKESLILLFMGIVTIAYVGRNDKVNWSLLALGVFLAFCVRPHVAAVETMAVGAAYWLGSWDKVTPRRMAESVAALLIAVVAFSGMTRAFGLEEADFESLQEFVTVRSTATMRGGSSIGNSPATGAKLPMAFVNIWLRPFPWDVHSMTSAFAAVEVVLLWYLIYKRRESLSRTVRWWRKDRLLRFAFPLLVGYTLMIGMTFANLGIIARQRTPLFPFLFLLLAAVPKKEQGRDSGGDPPVVIGTSRTGQAK